MYVEDLLLSIRSRLNHDLLRRQRPFDGLLVDEWSLNFVISVGQHVTAQKPLSTNQSKALLRIISRVRYPLVRHGLASIDDIDNMLSEPQFRRPLYESVRIPREARYLGNNLLGLRFKQYDTIIERIRSLGVPAIHDGMPIVPHTESQSRFDWYHKIWIVPVVRHNLAALTSLLNEFAFQIDPVTLGYLHLAQQSRDQPSSVSLAATHDALLVNVCDNPLLAGWTTEVNEGIAL